MKRVKQAQAKVGKRKGRTKAMQGKDNATTKVNHGNGEVNAR